ncbi:MAG: alanine racemase [bacterium]|nr:alanine racemase [bacterium]
MKQPLFHATVSSSGVVRPTRVEVRLDRLAANFRAIRDHVAPAGMMPIVKANAYGHGMVETARLVESLGADYIGVAVLEEGILLREAGIRCPILVLGGILGNQVPHFLAHGLTITASSLERLDQIDQAAGRMRMKAKIHLKIDTGMERIGVHHYNAEAFIEKAVSLPNLIVEGVFSHFANSESADRSSARLQLERFNGVLSIFDRRGFPRPRYTHMANSGAILQHPESRFDLVRPGILLYGVYPSDDVERTVAVKPALSWKSRVVYFKIIRPGNPVGYGSTWSCDHPVHAVTVPVGYGDGYFRAMSGKAHVLIRGKRYPVIGTISMDQIVVNLEEESAFSDDEVILIGGEGDGSIRCEDLASWAGTIPYEILTNINTRVPRVYSERPGSGSADPGGTN